MTSIGNNIMVNIAGTQSFQNNAQNKVHGENETITALSFASNGSISVTDSDGETFQLTMAAVAKDLGISQDDLKAELEKTDAVKSTNGTNAAEAATAATGSGSASELKAELEKLQQQKADNQEIMADLQDKITDLEKKVRESLEVATEKMEETEKQHKEAVQTAVTQQLEQFKVDKQNGKDVTPETLKQSIEKAVTGAGAPNFAKTIAETISADTNIKLMDNLLDVLNQHIEIDDSLDSEISSKEQAYEAAKAAEEAAKKSCDPIGFTYTDDNGEDVQIDFFVDKDNNGDISNENEFLGAEKNWDEMTALDEDGDGSVTTDEMKKAKENGTIEGDLMVVKNGKAMSLEEAFGDSEIAINLDSYKENANQGKDANGNVLLGTFGLTIDGKELATGYNTLDDVDWLKDNYNFSDYKTGEAGGAEAANDNSKEIKAFYETYVNEVVPELKEALANVKKNLGLSEKLLALIDEVSAESATLEATNITKEIEEKEEAQKAKRDENIEGTEETEEAGNEEEVDVAKKDEEDEIAA